MVTIAVICPRLGESAQGKISKTASPDFMCMGSSTARFFSGIKGYVMGAGDPDGKIMRIYADEDHDWTGYPIKIHLVGFRDRDPNAEELANVTACLYTHQLYAIMCNECASFVYPVSELLCIGILWLY